MISLENRPFSFDQMIGQKGVLKEFKKRSIKLDFPQVIILEGESGSGKSTSAFIIAALLNCTGNKINNNPCGECDSCKDIKSERFHRDVFYLNAADMSKDDVLKLEDRVSTVSMFDRNQILVIDEAQELSSKAFGAALNLLEKKRKNTYFLLCTMNIKKIDKAILSRGLVYKFKAIDSPEIASYLFNIIESSKLTVPDNFLTEGIFTISEFAKGNVRQAIQYLDRCVSGEFWTKEDILREFGFVDEKTMFNLLYNLLDHDYKFFSSVTEIDDLEGFFYKTWAILLNAWSLKGEGDFYDNIRSRSRSSLVDLLDVYHKAYQPNYFRNSYFLSCLIPYYANTMIARSMEKPAIRKVKLTQDEKDTIKRADEIKNRVDR